MGSGAIINGTIDAATSIVTNRTYRQKLRHYLKVIQSRKWLATFRGIPEFLSPTEFSRPSTTKIWKRLSCNIQYFFTNCLVFYSIFSFENISRFC